MTNACVTNDCVSLGGIVATVRGPDRDADLRSGVPGANVSGAGAQDARVPDARVPAADPTVAAAAPIVVFLHGIGSSRHGFGAQLDHFASQYQCICPDAPGYGDSPDPAKPLENMDDFAAIYETVLKDYVPSTSPIALVGVSFGGVLAARIAIRSQIEISALVLADSSRGSGVDPQRSAAMRQRADALRAAIRSSGAKAFAAERAPHLLSPTADTGMIDAVAENMTRSIRLPGYGYAAEAMASTDHTSRLADISCPTLVLVGEHDKVCPPNESQILADAIPDACYAELPGAGHLSNQEVPALFNQAVADFLAEHQKTAVLKSPAASNTSAPKTSTSKTLIPSKTSKTLTQKELHHVKT